VKKVIEEIKPVIEEEELKFNPKEADLEYLSVDLTNKIISQNKNL